MWSHLYQEGLELTVHIGTSFLLFVYVEMSTYVPRNLSDTSLPGFVISEYKEVTKSKYPSRKSKQSDYIHYSTS